MANIRRQVEPFLASDGDNPAVFVDNLDWTAPMSALDFLRDVGKHFRVNQMVRKEAIAARLNSDEGISYTEFSYQLLQGLDYLQLYRDFGCTLQTGGNDQWGNLTAGSDLIHRVEGASVHLLTTPLLTDSSGEKFGKSEGNAIWLSAEMTSPYAFYQYWLNVEDASVVTPAQGLHGPLPRGDRRARAPGGAGAVPAGGAADPGRRRHHAGPRRRGDGRRAGGVARRCSARGTCGRSTRAPCADATAELPGGEVHVGMSASSTRSSRWASSSRATPRAGRSARAAPRSTATKVTDVERVLEPDDLLHGRGGRAAARPQGPRRPGGSSGGSLTLGRGAARGSRFGFAPRASSTVLDVSPRGRNGRQADGCRARPKQAGPAS